MTSTKLNKITQGLKLALVVGATFSSQQLIAQENAGATASEDVETIQVRGLRASQVANLSNKRFADGVVDSITADDIGKLPDVTIADSLQRIPGVQIRRSSGEGATVNIRGMAQVGTMLNGEEFLSAGAITTSQPDFTDIPSALVGGMDVRKSAEADVLSNGISGSIDLKTRRPFDLEEGLTFASSAEFNRGSYTEENDGRFTAFAGYNTDKFGVVVSASYDESTLANYRYGLMHEGWAFFGAEGPAVDEGVGCRWGCKSEDTKVDVNGDGDYNDMYLHGVDFGNVSRRSLRERTGLSTTIQAQLTDTMRLTADVFYTKLDDVDHQYGLIADNAWSDYLWMEPLNAELRGTGASTGLDAYVATQMTLNAPRVNAYTEAQTNDRESLNINLELDFEITDKLSGSFRYLRGDAERSHTENVAQSYLTDGSAHNLNRRTEDVFEPVNVNGYSGRIPLGYDVSGDHPTLSFPTIDGEAFGSNLERYNMVSTYSENNFTEKGDLNVLRFDGKYDFDYGDLTTVKFGVRGSKREVERDTYILLAPFSGINGATGLEETQYVMWKDIGEAAIDTNGDGQRSTTGGDISLGQPNRLVNFDPSWIIQSSDFGPVNSGSFYFVNPEMMEDNIAFQNAFYPGNIKATNPNDSYKVEEDNISAYVRADFSGDNYRANVGLKYLKMDLTVRQNELGDAICILCAGGSADAGDIITEKSYDYILPSVNFAVDLSDDLILRGAYGENVSRLDLGRLGRGLSVGRSRAGDRADDLGVSPDLQVAIQGSLNGNPNLKPWSSTNFDLGLEWYFTESALLSVNAFNMKIDSFIVSGNSMMGLPDEDGVIRRQVSVTGEQNGQGGSIDGLEFSYHQAFDFLPDLWQGLGVSANYTYAPSDSGNVDFYGAPLPMVDNSERSANLVLWYEHNGLQLRLAGNYRSERLAAMNATGGNVGTPGNDLPLWTEATTYLDFSASYDINENFSVYGGVSNITEEYESNYLQWSDFTLSQNIYERRLTLGIRGRL
ncbi:TonB-dependent receptor [Bowmanella pacifica]|uniref:TonB-dependent receptor n=1 Tax=Bowmanella pacifica TaxID=502051 RepID=A0A917YXT8_9ALTE|nr:TonB-dependent receptor [Bowmanella pacifica]GGO69700.1 TonB-dependent receptor [Bowmanella pacifica]